MLKKETYLMAYLRIQPFRARLDKGVSYVVNSKKTELRKDALNTLFEYTKDEEKTSEGSKIFVSGINCDPENAVKEFLDVQIANGKEKDDIIAHHGWRSFHKGETRDPFLVHKMGIEFANEYFGDRFQVVVTTHLDKEHLHNHFFINAVSFKDGKKYLGNKESLRKARKISDEQCKKYGLSVIKSPNKYSKSPGLYRLEKRGISSYRELIKMDIDSSKEKARTLNEFKEIMRKKGYLFKEGKYFAVSPPDFYRNKKRGYIRLRSLNDYYYSYEYLEKYFKEKRYLDKFYYPKNKNKVFRVNKKLKKRKLTGLERKYIKVLFFIGAIQKGRYISEKERRYYESLAKNITEKNMYIHRNKLRTKADVYTKKTEVETSLNELYKKRKSIYKNNGVEKEELKGVNDDIKEKRKELKIINSVYEGIDTEEFKKVIAGKKKGEDDLGKPETFDTRNKERKKKCQRREGENYVSRS